MYLTQIFRQLIMTFFVLCPDWQNKSPSTFSEWGKKQFKQSMMHSFIHVKIIQGFNDMSVNDVNNDKMSFWGELFLVWSNNSDLY